MGKKALNVIFSPKMIIPGNDPLTTIMNTHQKKRYQKETKKKMKNCALIRSASMHHHQINHRTLFYHKNCAFAMSMCITSIIYLLLYGYTMITYLLIMMINTTTTTNMYTKICISYLCQIILAQWQAAP